MSKKKILEDLGREGRITSCWDTWVVMEKVASEEILTDGEVSNHRDMGETFQLNGTN